MRMVYATLGWHVTFLQPAIRRVEDLEAMVFYYGHIDKQKAINNTIKTRDEMIAICDQLGIKSYPKKLPDIYDFVGIVKRIKKDIEKDVGRKNDILLFNIAGGTKLMCSAALMVCIFKGIPALYVNERTGEPVAIPILEADYLSALTPAEKNLALFIIESREKNLTQSQLAKELGKTKATINQHIQKLEEKGIVVQSLSKDGKSKLVKPSEGIELLFL